MTTRLSNDYFAFPYIFFRRLDRSLDVFIFLNPARLVYLRASPLFLGAIDRSQPIRVESPRFESLLSKKTRRQSDPAFAQCNAATQSQAVTSGGTGPFRAPLSKPQLPADARRAGSSACGRGLPDRRRESSGTGGR